jgi:tetratricopeptide (TPR) repeat protein
MQRALALQQAGDLAGASARYESVLAEDPRNFDALHMLGVACYQRHDFDRAEALLRQAIAVNPAVAGAQRNLALVREARRLEHAEEALCRAVLPRLAHLCAPAEAFDAALRQAEAIDVLVAVRPHSVLHEPLLVALASGMLGPARVHGSGGASALPGDFPVVTPGTGLRAPVCLLYGLDEPPDVWGAIAEDAARVLVATEDSPSRLHDRLRELSGQGRHRVHLRYATPSLRDALGLPGAALPLSGEALAPGATAHPGAGAGP